MSLVCGARQSRSLLPVVPCWALWPSSSKAYCATLWPACSCWSTGNMIGSRYVKIDAIAGFPGWPTQLGNSQWTRMIAFDFHCDSYTVVLRRLHTDGRQRIHLHQLFLHLTDLVHGISSPRDYMVTFEPMPLIHIPLNVQMHCHIICGKHQILSSFCH